MKLETIKEDATSSTPNNNNNNNTATNNKDAKNNDKASAIRSKHSVTEQWRRSKINERFQILRDLIPNSDQKRDTASFLLEHFQKEGSKGHKGNQEVCPKAIITTDVRVDVKLNKHVWSRGIRSVPRRVRVPVARKRNDEEDAKEEFFSLVTVAEEFYLFFLFKFLSFIETL